MTNQELLEYIRHVSTAKKRLAEKFQPDPQPVRTYFDGKADAFCEVVSELDKLEIMLMIAQEKPPIIGGVEP